MNRKGHLWDVDSSELLDECGVPDPELLKGTAWERRRYRRHVDERIFYRELALFNDLGIDQAAYKLAINLLAHEKLYEATKAILARDDLEAIRDRVVAISRDERALETADLEERLACCERCGIQGVQWYEIRHVRRLCEPCAQFLAGRQRSTSTNIQPALDVARRRGLPSTLTLEEWMRTIEHFQDRCAYCVRDWDVVEHVTPLDEHGGTTVANCVPACHSCNISKGGRSLEEWIKQSPNGDARICREHALDWLIENGREPA